jgi:hypothetical protein
MTKDYFDVNITSGIKTGMHKVKFDCKTAKFKAPFGALTELQFSQ